MGKLYRWLGFKYTPQRDHLKLIVASVLVDLDFHVCIEQLAWWIIDLDASIPNRNNRMAIDSSPVVDICVCAYIVVALKVGTHFL